MLYLPGASGISFAIAFRGVPTVVFGVNQVDATPNEEGSYQQE